MNIFQLTDNVVQNTNGHTEFELCKTNEERQAMIDDAQQAIEQAQKEIIQNANDKAEYEKHLLDNVQFGDEFITEDGSHLFFYKTGGPSFTESYHYKFLSKKYGILKYGQDLHLIEHYVSSGKDDIYIDWKEALDLKIKEKIKK